MQVGILTWFKFHNYGTALQVVALSQAIKTMGFSPSVINYHTKGYARNTYSTSFFDFFVSALLRKGKSYFNKEYRSKQREYKFEQFYSHNLKFTKQCETMSELYDVQKSMSAVVCGSDQIWSPICFDSHYYLDFVADDNKKIAYAPSVGTINYVNKEIQKHISALVQHFAYLSTREEQGSKIIANLSGREVATVLDPTLLLTSDEWNKIIETEIDESKPYLLVYFLGKNERHWSEVYKLAKKFNLQVRIVPVFAKDFKRHGYIRNVIGPEEFVAYFRKATFVCTDSYHGTLFSINYKKQFIVFERFKNDDERNQNSRVYNILNVLNLQNRLVKFNGSSSEFLFEGIDYIAVDSKLKELREKSFAYLKNALDTTVKMSRPEGKHILQDLKLCCGCGACSTICPVQAISIQRNEDGFYQAFVDEKKCIQCGKCKSVCPFLNYGDKQPIEQGKVYYFKDCDKNVLLHSSSGGAAYRLAATLAEHGYNIVGCEFDTATHSARHIVVPPGDIEGLHRLQGSKYMQSYFAGVMADLQNINGPIAVFGTPCQIAGVRNLMGDKKDLLFVDLICHGVPSYNLYLRYMDYLQTEKDISPEGLKTIFRFKPKGWRERYIYNENYQKKIVTHQSKDLYFLSFEHGVCYADTCLECLWRDSCAADIRVGDFWSLKFKDDKTGVSLVVSYTDKGHSLIEELKKSFECLIKEYDISDYLGCQQTKNYPSPLCRRNFLEELKDRDSNLQDMVDKYVMPMQHEREYRNIFLPLWRLIRRVIKK